MYYQPPQVRKKGEKLVLKKAIQQSKYMTSKTFMAFILVRKYCTPQQKFALSRYPNQKMRGLEI